RRTQLAAAPAGVPAATPKKSTAADQDRDALFGTSLDGRQQRAMAAPRGEYQDPPLTVECRTRLRGKSGFNLLVANAPKGSTTHWELYTTAGSGTFSAYLPGFTPDVIDSGVPIVDDAWHDLAMVYEPTRVRLFVDGRAVANREFAPRAANPQPG